MAELFDMGKYTAYVWSSYGITLTVLVFSFVVPVWQFKKLKKVLARRIRARGLRK